jgi:metal-responsive CopG/Arc/MetJ family transcriptional regulator
VCVRLRITLDDKLVREIDELFGSGQRSAFVAVAVREALDNEHRWELIEAGLGSISDAGHEWDDDPAAWVRTQRCGDPRRVG